MPVRSPQCNLEQVIRSMNVIAQQRCGAEERSRPGAHELLEVAVEFGAHDHVDSGGNAVVASVAEEAREDGQAEVCSASLARSCSTAFVCIWQMRLSVTPRTWPISAKVRPS